MISRRRPIDEFPPLLALSPRPEALWVRGDLPSRPAVAVVGTRQPSPEGARFAFELAASLARAGVAVWSGGAAGIDEQAHLGALDADGPTVLLSGGGLDRPYPRAFAPLWRRIVQRGGALISTVDDDHPALRWTFFARNAVLAALTQATLVVECPLQSGARNTAAVARQLGRPVWIAGQTPWSPFAATVREELRLGASLLLHPDDLLRSLALPSLALPSPPGAPQLALPLASRWRSPPSDGSLGSRIWEAVVAGVRHPDALCERLGVTPPELLAEATLLLLSGYLTEGACGSFEPIPEA